VSILDDLKPQQKPNVIDLLSATGADVSAWSNYKGSPSRNPAYCYNWSFEQPDEFVTLCLWHRNLDLQGSTVIQRIPHRSPNWSSTSEWSQVWHRRAAAFDRSLALAFQHQLPLRVIVVDGGRRNETTVTSGVSGRLLDEVPWAVTEYDYATGKCLLVRGASPVAAAPLDISDPLSWFEGAEKQKFVRHRQRESSARAAKIAHVLIQNGGRLVCEVRNCGFDFEKRYGSLGKDYAQVHHLSPLSYSPSKGRVVGLADLAIVCANCHVMVHRGGECRPLNTLIVK
jgi:hypothetical protein